MSCVVNGLWLIKLKVMVSSLQDEDGTAKAIVKAIEREENQYQVGMNSLWLCA